MNATLPLFSDTEAVFDPTRRYRYRISRRLGPKAGQRVLFVMFNSSTASPDRLDPTWTRCCGFTRSWGARTVSAVNLFAWVSPRPWDLLPLADPVGEENDFHILGAAREADLIVCAWGALVDAPKLRALARPRVAAVLEMLRGAGRPLHALRITASGAPEHPLFLPGLLTPRPFDP